MKINVFERFDYLLILIVMSLVTTGIFFIYSSGINSQGISVTNEHIKQIVWASIGFVIMILVSFYDYRKLERKSLFFYLAIIILLLVTLIIGKKVNGARSWLGIGDFGIQPSEFGKIAFILCLASYLNQSKNENQLKRFFISLAILALPLILILLQPDMGTASVYIPVFFMMSFFAGIPVYYLLYTLSFGLLTIILAVLPVWNSEIAAFPIPVISILSDPKLRLILIISLAFLTFAGFIIRKYFHDPKYIFWISVVLSVITISLIFSVLLRNFLKDYQIMRLIIFIDPTVDPLGSGWNIIQSKTAIGAGGLFGQGFLNGSQSHNRFLPQQSTDFIFSIFSEEAGFFGGIIVFALYFMIFLRILLIIRKTSNFFGVYIASGILGMFAFHFFINVGMVIGIMPITGIPLLFMSYGGSSLLTAMTCVGLLMNINYNSKNLR